MNTYIRPVAEKKTKRPRNMTWTPTLEDRKLMEELKHDIGVEADAELMRAGLRALKREREGLNR